jgi:hypothetical protein
VTDPAKGPSYKWVYNEYLDAALPIVHQRMAQAGYRLADTVAMLFEGEKSDKEEE